MTIDEILALAADQEPEVDRAWRELCLATVNLGAAAARWQNACDRYVALTPRP